MYRFLYQKDFSQEKRDYIKRSDRCQNIMTQAKIQPFGKKYNLNQGVFNAKQRSILSRSVTEGNVCSLIYNIHFCVIRKIKQSIYPDAVKELEEKFKHEANYISDAISKQN